MWRNNGIRLALCLLLWGWCGNVLAQEWTFEVLLGDGGEKPGVPLTNVHDVVIDDIVVDVRTLAVPPLDLPSDPAEVQASGYRLYGPGQAHYGSITIRSRVGGLDEKVLHEWWTEASRGKNIRKSISVVCTKREKGGERRYNLLDCFPTSFSTGEPSPTGEALLTLACDIGSVELGTGNDPGDLAGPVHLETENSDGTLGTDTGWNSWSGGEPGVIREGSLGSAQFHTTTPGHKYVDTLTLRGPLTSGRKALCQWITETVQGKPWKRTLTVKEITRDGGAGKKKDKGRTFTYLDCFPTRYSFPVFSTESTGSLYEEITVKPIRVEMK